MYFDIIKAKYVSDYKIELFFEDKESGVVDFSDYIGNNDVFELFNDLNYFKKFTLDNGTLIWNDGELDIASETIYEKATGKNIDLYKNKMSITK